MHSQPDFKVLQKATMEYLSEEKELMFNLTQNSGVDVECTQFVLKNQCRFCKQEQNTLFLINFTSSPPLTLKLSLEFDVFCPR
jgi:hypothetical protein